MPEDAYISEFIVDLSVNNYVIPSGAALAPRGQLIHRYDNLGIMANPRVQHAIQTAAMPPQRPLTRTESIGLRAFQARNQTPLAAPPPFYAHSWDTAPPDLPSEPSELGIAAAPFIFPDTSAYLVGKVAVGLIFVQGPQDSLRFTDDEITFINTKVQDGLSWLAMQEPNADIVWNYDIAEPEITARPHLSAGSVEALEAVWRDPALDALNCEPGDAGVYEYVLALIAEKEAEHGYCAFFTKYPIYHFAYAWLGGPYLVMSNQLDTWGRDNLDTIFVHETAHIFGAGDEYATSKCNCSERFGYHRIRNENCENCSGSPAACIMRDNVRELCEITRRQLGWDRYAGGRIDPTDPIRYPKAWLHDWLHDAHPDIFNNLAEPSRPVYEDVVPLSLLGEVLDTENMERVLESISKAQDDYLHRLQEYFNRGFRPRK